MDNKINDIAYMYDSKISLSSVSHKELQEGGVPPALKLTAPALFFIFTW